MFKGCFMGYLDYLLDCLWSFHGLVVVGFVVRFVSVYDMIKEVF